MKFIDDFIIFLDRYNLIDTIIFQIFRYNYNLKKKVDKLMKIYIKYNIINKNFIL